MKRVDSEGKNTDPTTCDCGKGYFCPLWDSEWAEFYEVNVDGMRSIQVHAEENDIPILIYDPHKIYMFSTIFLNAWRQGYDDNKEYFNKRSK